MLAAAEMSLLVFFRWYRAEYEDEKYENFKENNT